MKSIVKQIRLAFTGDDKPELTLTLTLPRKDAQTAFQSLQEVLTNGKQLEVEVRQYRKRRSLDANSYAWLLMSKMADVVKTSKEEVYIEMLKRYGQREPQLLSVIAEGVPAIMRAIDNHCTEVGESTLNGKLFKHMAILIGSSQYDTRSMSILIDGIVQDCKELGIETITPQELESLKNSWGR